ncbi:MAG: 3-oxoacid CoA-transferase subunit B [Synergistaceae bacterium]|jgi:acetate CoA/acetoacetate CoA-transferase beta subunit|nr:3-oxoacid CoA-transferase subunit B [Synergistaceae bacterium]
MDAKEIIAKRVAQELHDGDVVNLGIGLPTMVPNYLPSGVSLVLQSENGMLGMGPSPEPGKENPELVNAGGVHASCLPGGCFFDSCTSFGIIRGGHVQATVLGAMEVDEEGSLANWKVPGKLLPGMGGAMDLVVGAKEVIVAMVHTQKGAPKILKKCTLPLTAKKQVNKIITELAYIEVTDKGLTLRELGPGAAVEDVVASTEAKLIIPEKVGRYFE